MNKKGFTLAEVLITLLIIGIIAAMTLPTLFYKYKVIVTRAKVQHIYSVLTQAYEKAENEYGGPVSWGMTGNNPESATKFANKMLASMQVSIDCGTTTNVQKGSKCWANKRLKYVTGKEIGWDSFNFAISKTYYKVVLPDGTSLVFTSRSSRVGDCTVKTGDKKIGTYCGYILADINGPKKSSNQLGDDVFQFYLREGGIEPAGSPEDFSEPIKYDSDTTVKNPAGWGTAWWILHYGNMDYLKCPTKLNHNKRTCN